MKKLVLIILTFASICGCKDEFNLPEYNSIEDLESPVISVASPIGNNTYNGLTQLPINIEFTDNYEIEAVQFQLSPTNVSGPSMSFTKMVNDSVYRIDTVYNVPQVDSVDYNVLIIANDIVNNTRSIELLIYH